MRIVGSMRTHFVSNPQASKDASKWGWGFTNFNFMLEHFKVYRGMLYGSPYVEWGVGGSSDRYGI